MNTQPLPVIGYCRVSSEEQAREGVSLDAQRARIRAYCDLHALTCGDVLADEGISGCKLANRPAAREVINRIRRREVSGLVIVKLDRFCRNTRDALDLMDLCGRRGVALHSINEKLDTSTPMGQFVFTIIAAIGQLERQMTGERMKFVHEHQRRRNRRLGFIPYGWTLGDDGKTLIPREDQQRIIARMRLLKAAGASNAAIAGQLNAEGIPAPTGRRWYASSVRSILNSSAKREVLNVA